MNNRKITVHQQYIHKILRIIIFIIFTMYAGDGPSFLIVLGVLGTLFHLGVAGSAIPSETSFSVGKFNIVIDDANLAITVSYLNDIVVGEGKEKRILWSTHSEGNAFVKVAVAQETRPPILDGNFQMEEEIGFTTSTQTIKNVSYTWATTTATPTTTTPPSPSLLIQGTVGTSAIDCVASYQLVFSESPLSSNQLHFEISATPSCTSVATTGNSVINRLFLSYTCAEDETFHGFGESFADFNLKGRRIPILVSEQGVGRDLAPISQLLNAQTEGVGGHWYTTYAPKPLYVTNNNRSVVFENSEVMYIDLSSESLTTVEVELWGLHMQGNILYGTSMRNLVDEITLVTGRMYKIPDWTQRGAIVGLEGGTRNVTQIVSSLRAAGVPIVGVWLQDWVGLRHSYDGDRLIWNWEVNYDQYPGWNRMVSAWDVEGIKTLTYINPFFSDPSEFTNQSRHNFYQEGLENGYFVQHANGSAYKMYSLSIEFCMVDLTNPAAYSWMKTIIKDYSIDEAASSGWMADFGEYLPFDAKLYSGVDAASYHNVYPQDWAKLVLESVQESDKQEDIVFFMRSSWMKSPAYNSVFWEGDQLISWDASDGLKSVILGALSGGLSGHSITHSDIGGYTVMTSYPLSSCYFVRDEELLSRWTELATFGAGMFRTHMGSAILDDNFQVYDTDSSMAHFARFANIFASLAEYRATLISEALSSGLPLMRPMAMNYAYDATAWNLQEQYLFGDDFIVAPCMEQGADKVRVYIPACSGDWVHVWSGNVIPSHCDTDGVLTGEWLESVPSAMNFPAVFFQSASTAGWALREYVLSQEYTDGYVWDM